jgi:cyanophycinase
MQPKGKLISIGGSVDKGTEPEQYYRENNNIHFFALAILKRIVAETDDANPLIEIITTASSIPEEVGQTYLDAFERVGNNRTQLLHIRNREEAQNPEYENRIRNADAVLFTGGNQLRLTTIFGGTEIMRILHHRYLHESGFVIAGTSAGAMAMSNTMIYQGSSHEALLKGEVKITTGLAFIKDVIIDSHFVQRGRFGRLAQAVATNPGCIGIGLGEDTAVVVSEGDHLEAIGSGLIVVVDGHHMKHTNITEIPDGTPISIENLHVHIMAPGDVYELHSRKFTGRTVVVQPVE